MSDGEILHSKERQRLEALRALGILDTPPESLFDDAALLAAQICGVPIAAVGLIDENREWFKAAVGLDVQEADRDIAFCAHTILQPDVLLVPNAAEDARFADNPLVTGDPHIRFYAGAPLVTSDGYAVGSLYVVDQIPRQLSDQQIAALKALGRQVISNLETRQCAAREKRQYHERETARAELARSEGRFQSAMSALHEGVLIFDPEGVITDCNASAAEILGILAEDVIGCRDFLSATYGAWINEEMDCIDLGNHPVNDTLLRGIACKDCVVGYYSPSGALCWLSINTAAMRQNDAQEEGTGRAVVVTLSDITSSREIAQEASRLAAIINDSSDAILAATLDGTLVSWNAGAERLYGYSADEMIGKHASVLAAPGEERLVASAIAALQRGEAMPIAEVVRQRKDGSVIDLSLSFSPIRNAGGGVIGISCIARDISARKTAEALLLESEDRARRLSDAAFEGISISQHGLIHDVNLGFAALYGADRASLIGLPGVELVTPEFRELVRQKVAAGNESPYEATCLRRDGSTFVAEIRGRGILLGGEPARITAVRDITERKEAEQAIKDYSVALEFQKAELEEANKRLKALATTDGLTGLANHRELQERLKAEFERARRYNEPLSLVMLDVDSFKSYNDTFGHPAGDAVLVQVAKIIKLHARTTDLAARYGGEEFALLLPHTGTTGANVVAERLRAAVESARWDKRQVTISVGVASAQAAMMDGASLTGAADMALYVSKRSGRNRVSVG